MHHATLTHMGAWSFGDSKRAGVGKEHDEIPGPGTYNPKFSKSCTGWTQSKKDRMFTFIKQGQGAPVGTYDINSECVIPQTTKYSIGCEKRNKPINNLTKSTNYRPNNSLTKPSAPYYSFGQVPEPLSCLITPSPLDYNPTVTKKQFNNQNHFTCGMRQLQKDSVPGVGDYDINQNKIKTPSYRIATAEEPFYKNRTPDVFYNIAGDLRSFKKGKSFSFRNKKKSLSLSINNPPPGAYDPIYPQSNKNIISMYAKRDSLIPEQSKLIPGPGAYNTSQINDSFNKTTKRGTGFAQSYRPDICKSNTPGPGSYNVSLNLRTNLGKMARVKRYSITTQTPGPASYSPQQLLTNTRKSLTMYSNRVDFSLSDTKQIGPGQYNCQIKPQTYYGTMGKSKRNHSFTQNPGPGQYDIPSTIGRIPKYYKNLHRKIAQNGETTIIKYSPQKTRQIKVNLFDNTKKNDEK